jgi:hypothetical protein
VSSKLSNMPVLCVSLTAESECQTDPGELYNRSREDIQTVCHSDCVKSEIAFLKEQSHLGHTVDGSTIVELQHTPEVRAHDRIERCCVIVIIYSRNLVLQKALREFSSHKSLNCCPGIHVNHSKQGIHHESPPTRAYA